MPILPPKAGEVIRAPFLRQVWNRIMRQRIRTAPPLFHIESEGGTLIGIKQQPTIMPVTAPAGGIAARSGATPGSATCKRNTWDGTAYGTAGNDVVVKNDITEAVPANAQVKAFYWSGEWWVLGWTCT